MKSVIAILIIIFLVMPTASAVVYPPEYYSLTQIADSEYKSCGMFMCGYDGPAVRSFDARLRAIQIAIEKQNEILENASCYRGTPDGTSVCLDHFVKIVPWGIVRDSDTMGDIITNVSINVSDDVTGEPIANGIVSTDGSVKAPLCPWTKYEVEIRRGNHVLIYHFYPYDSEYNLFTSWII
jgi:hypothetical protein